MNRIIKRLLMLSVIAAMLLASVPSFVSASSSPSHTAIAVNPGELAQPGPVTVTIVLRNTSTVSPTTPPISTPDPGTTPSPIVTTPPGEGKTGGKEYAYTDIAISNSYGVTFNTEGVSISPGSQYAFSGTLNATDDLIGVPLTFTISWSYNGSRYAETATCTIIRRNVSPYLQVTRTATPIKAAPGTEVTFKYTFTNTGSVTLVDIQLSDRNVFGTSSTAYTINTLQPGESSEYVYVMTMGNSTVVSSPVITFYAYGGTTKLTNNVPSLTIGVIQSQLTKEVVMGEPTPEGVMFTLYLTNNGNMTLSNLKVTDELGNAVNSQTFKLAVGESKVLDYFVRDPETVRYVVFSIRGNDSTGTEFRDNTSSYIVRPYIDKSLEGLSFTAVTTSSLNEEKTVGIEFNVQNTGSLELYNITVTEEQLDFELFRIKTLPVGESNKQQMDVNIGELRNLIFMLKAEDSSGNTYTYEAHVTADDIDVGDLIPTPDPNKQDIEVDPDDPGLTKKLDSLMTDVGVKLQKWFRTLGIIAAVAAVAILALTITEIVLRRNKRSKKTR